MQTITVNTPCFYDFIQNLILGESRTICGVTHVADAEKGFEEANRKGVGRIEKFITLLWSLLEHSNLEITTEEMAHLHGINAGRFQKCASNQVIKRSAATK